MVEGVHPVLGVVVVVEEEVVVLLHLVGEEVGEVEHTLGEEVELRPRASPPSPPLPSSPRGGGGATIPSAFAGSCSTTFGKSGMFDPGTDGAIEGPRSALMEKKRQNNCSVE